MIFGTPRFHTMTLRALVALSVIAAASHVDAASNRVEVTGLVAMSTQGARAASQTVEVGADALQALAQRPPAALLRDLPLPDGTTETFEVTAFDVFSPHAQIYEFDGTTRRPVTAPNVVLFSGTGERDASNFAVISIVDGKSLRAVFERDGSLLATIGPAATASQPNRHEMQGPDAVRSALTNAMCDGPAGSQTIAAGETITGSTAGTPRAAEPQLEIEMGIDFGNDLLSHGFFNDSSAAAAYAGSLVGAISAIYQRDLKLVPKISTLVLWTTLEPFASGSGQTKLNDYTAYDSNRAGPEDVDHYFGGFGTAGGANGIAWLGQGSSFGACSGNRDEAVSNLGNDFAANLYVAAHEMGHTLGSVHTHCYNPPLDHCYNLEAGCYSGPVEPSLGEIMSYCGNLGAGAFEFVFRGIVGNTIRTFAANHSCLVQKVPSCGDGVRDPGEQCDDGNADETDCCSSSCMLLGVAGCNDNDPCTEDYTCPNSSCWHQPVDCDDGVDCTRDYCDPQDGGCHNFGIGVCSVCGNGEWDQNEQCDDGNTADGDCCSSICQYDAAGTTCSDALNFTGQCDGYGACYACGNGVVDPGEFCDDGNHIDGDGCGAACEYQDPQCGNGYLSAFEECEDGNHVSGDCCGGYTCQIESQCLGSFEAYQVKAAKTPAFVRQQIALQDAYGSHTLDVKKPWTLGVPVTSDHGFVGGAGDAARNLECYKAKDLAKLAPPKNMHAVLRYAPYPGSTNYYEFTAGKAVRGVCMPTAKGNVATDPGADRFTCYGIKGAAPGDAFYLGSPITLTNDLETKQMVIGAASLLCSPAQATLGALQTPGRHLVCFKVKLAKTDPKQEKLAPQSFATENSFGNEGLTATKASLVCVSGFVSTSLYQ